MPLPDVFDPAVTAALLARLERLQPDMQPRWGDVDATWMVEHCARTYETDWEQEHARLSPLWRALNRWVIKWRVTSESPFSEAAPGPASPVLANAAELDRARQRLSACIRETHGLGTQAFEGKRHPLFGRLSARQWSNHFWKHLDHHLRQFGL